MSHAFINTSIFCSVCSSPAAEAVESVHQTGPIRLRRQWTAIGRPIGELKPSYGATTELQLCICSWSHAHIGQEQDKHPNTLSLRWTASTHTLHSRVTHTNTHTLYMPRPKWRRRSPDHRREPWCLMLALNMKKHGHTLHPVTNHSRMKIWNIRPLRLLYILNTLSRLII